MLLPLTMLPANTASSKLLTCKAGYTYARSTYQHSAMDAPPQQRPTTSSLFEVYLRLRPSHSQSSDHFLDLEETKSGCPTHIRVKPPADDYRKRAVERFAFTKVFQEDASQLDIFEGAGVLPLIEGVLGADGREGRDGLLATLGVTGSGKARCRL